MSAPRDPAMQTVSDELSRLESENLRLQLELDCAKERQDKERRLKDAQTKNANLKRWLKEIEAEQS